MRFYFTAIVDSTGICSLSLHDALPISGDVALEAAPDFAVGLAFGSAALLVGAGPGERRRAEGKTDRRSEEHTSELQSRQYLVCRLVLEKKKESMRLC